MKQKEGTNVKGPKCYALEGSCLGKHFLDASSKHLIITFFIGYTPFKILAKQLPGHSLNIQNRK